MSKRFIFSFLLLSTLWACNSSEQANIEQEAEYQLIFPQTSTESWNFSTAPFMTPEEAIMVASSPELATLNSLLQDQALAQDWRKLHAAIQGHFEQVEWNMAKKVFLYNEAGNHMLRRHLLRMGTNTATDMLAAIDYYSRLMLEVKTEDASLMLQSFKKLAGTWSAQEIQTHTNATLQNAYQAITRYEQRPEMQSIERRSESAVERKWRSMAERQHMELVEATMALEQFLTDL